MPKVIFNPKKMEFDVNPNTKILAVALQNKVEIQYGCAACRCGTCGIKVEIDDPKFLNSMDSDESELLAKMGLDHKSGNIRLACRARAMEGTITVDLDFQSNYSPDQALDDSGLPK